MAIGKLYISHVNYDFTGLNSQPLTSNNLKEAIRSKIVSDYHTSLEDCAVKKENINEGLLDHAREIIPLDLVGNTKNNTGSYVSLAYEIIQHHADKCNDIDQFMDLLVYGQFNYHYHFDKVSPTTNKEKLWIVGCSFSSMARPEYTEVYGENPDSIQFVKNHERWGYIVAKELGFEEINLASAGSSIYDGLRRIIESDAERGDKMIWQITVETRDTTAYPYGLIRSLKSDSDVVYEPLIDYTGSLDQKLTNFMHIRLGIEYCKKQGIDLYIVNMLADHDWLSKFCQGEKYIWISGWDSIDTGTDGGHPGPKQNKEYAKKIIKFIQGS